MTAAVLREAAALMRARAEEATDANGDDWCAEGNYDVRSTGRSHDEHTGALVAEAHDPHAAEHIASWHPAVALTVADWLEETAVFFSKPGHRDWHGPESAAVAIATAYLGSAS